jgi:hypothetical protein
VLDTFGICCSLITTFHLLLCVVKKVDKQGNKVSCLMIDSCSVALILEFLILLTEHDNQIFRCLETK